MQPHSIGLILRMMGQCEPFGRSEESYSNKTNSLLSTENSIAVSLKTYKLEFQEGYQLQTEPEPRVFKARNDEEALQFVLDIFELKGQLTQKKFHRAGGAYLFCGSRIVFPRPKNK